MRLNSEEDESIAFDVITEILEYVEQQNDKGISYEHKYYNIVEYLISERDNLCRYGDDE